MDQKEQMYQLRQAQIYLAEEVKRICEANDIQYFIDCGSMLGAVRHKGYIPWDDDMDISFPKKEYAKFLEVAPSQLGPEFFLDCGKTNPRFANVYAKLRLKGTKYIELRGNKDAEHNEIFIDLFSYYYVSDSLRQREIDIFFQSLPGWAMLSKAGCDFLAGQSRLKRMAFLPADILGRLLSFDTLRKWANHYYNKYEDTAEMGIFSGSFHSYHKWVVPKELLNEFITAEFEGHSFPILKEYDKFLSIVYGDYMTLPPVEQRRTHLIQYLDMGPYHFE